jgi:hypothetical protein
MSQNLQPLSSAEKALLQDLLSRAALSEESGEPSTPGSFSVVDSMNHGGAMNDASKRLNPVSDEGESSKRPYNTIPGTTEPLASPTLLGRTPHGKAIFLPAGVSDMESWGRSVIQFGKYMNKRGTPGISYEELFASRLIEEEKRTYVRWVMNQVDSAKGHLLDLGLYLCVRTDECLQGNQLPMVPGTGVVRIFK